MANTSLNLVDVDFDTLKQNFKSYLSSSSSPFKDYDFEGSNISQLLDVLTYNTYLNNYYLNMVGSEMFLDSAALRDSVVSHAKELNYVPRSFRSAEATISFYVTPTPSTLSNLVVPKGTTFTSKVGSNSFTFSTTDSYTFTQNTSGVIPVTLTVYEGNYLTDTFIYNSANTNQRFILSNQTIDTRFLSVSVIEDTGANVYTYAKHTSLLGVYANTFAYFLQAAENNQYEILFGDGVKGRQPKNGSTIAVTYLVGNGELPNGARTFNIDGPIQGQAVISSINTVSSAVGGSINESVSSIKFNAPRHYQNQERAVTATDYETLLTANFPEIAGASAFGGEDRDPPVYGKVFVAVDLYTGIGVTNTSKTAYYDFLKKRAPVSIDPVIIDPERMYVEVYANVRYNTSLTNLKVADIKTIVENTVSTYNADYLNGFNKTLRSSKLIELINNSHSSILSVDLEAHPFKKFIPTTGSNYNAVIDYNFELTSSYQISYDTALKTVIPAIRSTSMSKGGRTVYLQDDSQGLLWLYGTDTNGNPAQLTKVGTVNYTSGRVVIDNLLIDSFTPASGAEVHLYATPIIKDISSTRGQIIQILDADISISVEAVKE